MLHTFEHVTTIWFVKLGLGACKLKKGLMDISVECNDFRSDKTKGTHREHLILNILIQGCP